MMRTHLTCWLLLLSSTSIGCAAAASPRASDVTGSSALKTDDGDQGAVALVDDLPTLDELISRNDARATTVDETARFAESSRVAVSLGELRAASSAICKVIEPDDDGRACRLLAETHFTELMERFTTALEGTGYVPPARPASQHCMDQVTAALDGKSPHDFESASFAGETLVWCMEDVASQLVSWAQRQRDETQPPDITEGSHVELYRALRTTGTAMCDALGATELAGGGPAHPLFWYGCDASITDMLIEQFAGF